MNESSIGYLDSIETMGLVDGPGVRVVVFLQGCPLRCIFCHNPETWNIDKKYQDYNEMILNIYQKEKCLNFEKFFAKIELRRNIIYTFSKIYKSIKNRRYSSL